MIHIGVRILLHETLRHTLSGAANKRKSLLYATIYYTVSSCLLITPTIHAKAGKHFIFLLTYLCNNGIYNTGIFVYLLFSNLIVSIGKQTKKNFFQNTP